MRTTETGTSIAELMITEDGSGSYLNNINTSSYNGLAFRTDAPIDTYRLTAEELSNDSVNSDMTVSSRVCRLRE